MFIIYNQEYRECLTLVWVRGGWKHARLCIEKRTEPLWALKHHLIDEIQVDENGMVKPHRKE